MSEPANANPNEHATETPTGYQIRTDRPCARCGFNLFGQTIFRESRYGLVAARCPECGQLAALQEYPSLGRWAGRWSGLLAGVWVLVILAVMLAQFGITFGMMPSTNEFGNDRDAQRIADAYQQDQARTSDGSIAAQSNIGPWTPIETDWWLANRESLIADRGGRWRMVNWYATGINVPLAVLLLGFGMFWSNALLGAKRRHAALLGIIPVLAAGAFTLPFAFPMLGNAGGGLTARSAYVSVVLPILLPICMGVALTACLLGVVIGRRTARILVCLSLPPRTRAALGVLWTRDGLAPPRAKASGGSRQNPS